MSSHANEKGLTLVEVLVVLAVFAVLIGLLVPAVQRVRHIALRTRCANNLHQIGIALHNYHGISHQFPAGVSYRDGKDPTPYMSWITRILPQLEHEQLWKEAMDAFQQEKSFLRAPPHFGLRTVLPIVNCPADPRNPEVRHIGLGIKVTYTSYLGVAGTDCTSRDGLLYLDSATRLAHINDGSSNTLLVGERPHSADGVLGWWYAGEGQAKNGSGDMVLGVLESNVSHYGPGCPAGPYSFGLGKLQNQCDAFHFWSLHSGEGAHFLFADGSVRFLSYSASSVLPGLATRNGGESIMPPG